MPFGSRLLDDGSVRRRMRKMRERGQEVQARERVWLWVSVDMK